MADPVSLTFGSPPSDHLTLRPVRRLHPAATDYWDGNWLLTEITVAVGGFRGRVEAHLRAEDFAEFRKSLAPLHSSQRSEAAFLTMEEWVAVRVASDGRGRIDARCEVTDRPGMGNRLAFHVSFDQSAIPAMLAALDAIDRDFPVLGSRGDA